MTDLVVRLTAAIDQAEQNAEAATPGPWHTCDTGVLADREGDDLGSGPQRIARMAMPYRTPKMEANAAHIAAWSPDVVLRHVEHARKIIALAEDLRRGERLDAYADQLLLDLAETWQVQP